MDKKKLWALLEQHFADILSKLGPEAAEAAEYIEHREFGLAYAVLTEGIQEGRITLDAHASRLLSETGQLMGLQP